MKAWLVGPAVAGLMLGLLTAPGATADPAPDTATGKQICTFTVSAPVAQALPGPGGAKGVTATLKWSKCEGLATPLYASVCISSPTSNGRCNKDIGWNSPTGIFPTQNPTGEFRAEGRGCYQTPESATTVCDRIVQTATV